MLKPVAEALLKMRNALEDARAQTIGKRDCQTALQINVVVINTYVSQTPTIKRAEADLLRAARVYADGGSSLTEFFVTIQEHAQALEATLASLLYYRDALRTAHLSDRARSIGLVDETQVSDPF